MTYIIRVKSHDNHYILIKNNSYPNPNKKNPFFGYHCKILEKPKRYDIKILETLKIYESFLDFYFFKIVHTKRNFYEMHRVDSETISIKNFYARYHEFQQNSLLLEFFFRKIKNLSLINLYELSNQKKKSTKKKIFSNNNRNYKYKNPHIFSKLKKKKKNLEQMAIF